MTDPREEQAYPPVHHAPSWSAPAPRRSGFAVASLVCGLLFLEPLLRSIARRAPLQRTTTARTATPLEANDHRQDYLRARFSSDENGLLVAEAHAKQDSSMMKILAHSDGLIVRPPNAPAAAAGAECPVIRLRS